MMEGKGLREHRWVPGIKEDLQEVLDDNQLVFGLQESSRKQFKHLIPNKDWVDADFLHKQSLNGELNTFIQFLRTKEVIGIGPSFLKDTLNDIVGLSDYIVIPDRDCYLYKDEILSKIPLTEATYIISASVLSTIIVSHLSHLPGPVIDCGSLWDIYAGRPSRSYHKRITKEIIQKNIL